MYHSHISLTRLPTYRIVSKTRSSYIKFGINYFRLILKVIWFLWRYKTIYLSNFSSYIWGRLVIKVVLFWRLYGTLFIEVKNESLGRDSLPRDSFLLQWKEYMRVSEFHRNWSFYLIKTSLLLKMQLFIILLFLEFCNFLLQDRTII